MAWTTPRTWVAGELVTEGNLNTHLRDQLLFLKTSVGDDGRIPALVSLYFASLDGSNVAGVAKTNAANAFTAGKNDLGAGSARIIFPAGADRWPT
jgi:hypothetical protein